MPNRSNTVFRVYGVVVGLTLAAVGILTLLYVFGVWDTLAISERFVGFICGIIFLVMGVGCSCLNVLQSVRTEDGN